MPGRTTRCEYGTTGAVFALAETANFLAQVRPPPEAQRQPRPGATWVTMLSRRRAL